MIYICLAAGKGTRFGTLGNYLQKCMYPVGLKPFVEYTLDNVVSSPLFDPDQDRIVFVVGHKQEQIRSHFGSTYKGVAITYVEQGEALGTGHAVRVGYSAAPVEGPVIAWLADSYIPQQTLDAVRHAQLRDVITVAEHDDGEPYRHRVDLESSQGRIARSWKGSSSYVEIGCWKLSQELLNRLIESESATLRSEDGEYRMLEILQERIDRGWKVGYVEASEWVHLGGTKPTPEHHLRTVVGHLAPGICPDIWRG